jgi:two-component system OmpR family response regulator
MTPELTEIEEKSIAEESLQYSAEPLSENEKEKNKKIKTTINVFLVDDDELYLNTLRSFLTNSLPDNFKFKTFLNAEEFIKEMDKKPEIVILDYILSTNSSKEVNGLSILKQINLISPNTFVIVLSAQDNVDVALDIINEGAYDYISKNKTAFLRLKKIIQNIAENISATIEQNRQEMITKRLNLLIITLLILLFIISRVIHN